MLMIAPSLSRTFPALVLYQTSLHDAKLSGRDETNTAAHTRRILRSTFQRTAGAVARSFSFDAKNNAASTRVRSRHRSGMLAAAHTQKASRNLQSSVPRLATRIVVFGARHRTTPTKPRDPLRRS